MRLIDADELKKAIIHHLGIRSEENLLESERSIYNLIDKQPTVEQSKWIPMSEGLPEERDTIFARFKGTDKWNPAMPEKMSDVVTVAVLMDGARIIKHTRMIDGKWEVENKPIKQVVTHWMPNPTLPKDGE